MRGVSMHDRLRYDLLGLLQFLVTKGNGFGCKDFKSGGTPALVVA